MHYEFALNIISFSLCYYLLDVTPPVKKRYAGDIKTPDFKTPRRARRNLFLLKTEINKKASRIKVLKQKERRWKEKITTLKKLVEHLQDNNLISDQAKETLIVSI